MFRLVTAAAAASSLFLGGCMTRCWEQTYFKPDIPELGTDLEVDRSRSGLEFRINRTAFVGLSECGWANRGAEGGAASLCITVVPEDGVLLNFETNRVRFLDASRAEVGAGEIEKLHYSIFCRESGPEPHCSSSIAPSSDSELSRRRSETRSGSYSIGVVVSPVRQWRGAADSQHGNIVPHRDKLRQYSTSVLFPKGIGGDVSVALPAIIVNGRRTLLPPVTFRRVSEKMCGTFA